MRRRLAIALSTVAVAAALAAPADANTEVVPGCGDPPPDASASVQREAMLCLVNAFRRDHGLRALRVSAKLQRVARSKAVAIDDCDSFSHTPCGRSFSSAFAAAGYADASWSGGENLVWGTGELGGVVKSFLALVHSAPHRANFLHDSWRDVGIALRKGEMFGYSGVTVWVIDFGRP